MKPPQTLVRPAAVTENLLKRRWSAVVLRDLEQGLTVPEDLVQREPGLSPAVLGERLRAMLRFGLVARFPGASPSTAVEFRLTARGRKILRILDLIEQLDELDQERISRCSLLEKKSTLPPPETPDRHAAAIGPARKATTPSTPVNHHRSAGSLAGPDPTLP